VIEKVVVMAQQHHPPTAGGKKDGEKHRDWPSLTLENPTPATPTFSPIEADHRLYPLAAWTYHHADALSPAMHAGLFVALERAWPRRGRRRSRHDRGVWVSWCLGRNIPPAAIAGKFGISEGEVLDLRRDYWKDWRQPIETARGDYLGDSDVPSDPRPRIDADPPDSAPWDPSTQAGALLSRENEGDENFRLARELIGEHGDHDLTCRAEGYAQLIRERES
jgi:hypothetical protein